ncbi:hypothetical protein [Sphingomonas sp. 1P08PE]|uniref:hypothetical protein n=1 Tax=Sphingomonas sp. 1P08PE TaxID=554122 RepID=UPI0039A3D2C9
MKHLLLAVATLGVVATPAYAAPCKDAKGKFVKCPEPTKTKAKVCRKDGKFAKCGTPGAR